MSEESRRRSRPGSISPLALKAYLQGAGWTPAGEVAEKAVVWRHSSYAGAEVVQPLRQTLGDYVARLADAVATLAELEDRRQEELVEDIRSSDCDRVVFTLSGSCVGEGALPILTAAEAYGHLRGVMVAGMRATIQKRPWFSGHWPIWATHYLEQVTVGRPRAGSYGIVVLSPLPQPSSHPLQPTSWREVNPFSRRVVVTLLTACAAVREAAEVRDAGERAQAFRQSVALGASANLCDALAAVGDLAMRLEIRGWLSSQVPVPTDWASRSMAFESELREPLREAARTLRAMEGVDAFDVIGQVVGLQRAFERQGGVATVRGQTPKGERQVRVSLDHDQYATAVAAHSKGRPLTCRGRLVREGRQWALVEVVAVSIG